MKQKTKNNGHDIEADKLITAEVLEGKDRDLPVIDPRLNAPDYVVGASMDFGNPGNRILAMDKHLPTMLKALVVSNDDEARDYAAALAWCQRWNRKSTDGRGNLDHHIEALKYRLSLKCSINALYTHLYGEYANGMITTDANGRSLSHILSKEKEKNNGRDKDDKLFGKI